MIIIVFLKTKEIPEVYEENLGGYSNREIGPLHGGTFDNVRLSIIGLI